MGNFIVVLFFVSVVAIVMHGKDENDEAYRETTGQRKVAAMARAERDRTKARKPLSSLSLDPSAGAVGMIRQASAAYDIPAGLIYGHWTAESGRLEGQHGTGKSWYTVRELIDGGKCAERYSVEKCREWHALARAICSQRKPDGWPVCDMRSTKFSISFDMGPMQLNPGTFAYLDPSGNLRPTKVTVDGDGDGVFNPFSQADAFASAAALIRLGIDSRGSYIGAIDRYRGAIKERYREKVTGGWQDWCSRYGCENRTMMAAK